MGSKQDYGARVGPESVLRGRFFPSVRATATDSVRLAGDPKSICITMNMYDMGATNLAGDPKRKE